MNAFKFIILILSLTCFRQSALGQYMETFDTDDKGIILGQCTTDNDPTSCTSHDFSGVEWTVSGLFTCCSEPNGFGAANDFKTNGGVLTTTTGDLDIEVCWVSPLLDISSAGTVSFTVDVSYTGFDGSDYMDVEYSINGGGFVVVQPNLVGSGGHTIQGPATGTSNDVGTSGLSGNTLQIRVCPDFNSNAENFTLDNVEVPEANVMILPIELAYFKGRITDDKQVALNWQTITERNNAYMIVERSKDGFTFKEIGRVEGKGTTEEPQWYNFVDEKPHPGLNYYRLRQIDFDGTNQLHKTIGVEVPFASRLSYNLFPNPAKEKVTLQLDSDLQEAGRLDVFNPNGLLLQTITFNRDNRSITLNLEPFPVGLYLLRIAAGGEVAQERIIKQ